MTTPNHLERTVKDFLNARLHRVSADDDDPYSASIVEEYCGLVDHVIFNRGYGHSLFRVNPEVLRSSDALIYVIRSHGKIQAGLHISRHKSGEFAWINGVVKADGQPSSLVRDLMAFSMLDYDRLPFERVPFRACYRKFPAGFRDQFGKVRTVNDGSAKLFRIFLFDVIGTENVDVDGNFQDAHLIDFCNPGTASFDVFIVESVRRSVHMSQEYLIRATQRSGHG